MLHHFVELSVADRGLRFVSLFIVIRQPTSLSPFARMSYSSEIFISYQFLALFDLTGSFQPSFFISHLSHLQFVKPSSLPTGSRSHSAPPVGSTGFRLTLRSDDGACFRPRLLQCLLLRRQLPGAGLPGSPG